MLDLLDYRRRVSALYASIRAFDSPQVAHVHFRRTRDDLFRQHPQSALSETQKQSFDGLRYYAYDQAYRVVASIDTGVEAAPYDVDLGADGHFTMRKIGEVQFSVPSGRDRLGVFWIEGYGGGLFIPFRDTTNGETTYGGGRYLYDTIKGADLGSNDGSLVLDFNFAYHPSCYYDERWVCPLAPPENRLAISIEAGEQLMDLA